MCKEELISARAVIDVETMIRAFKLHNGTRSLVWRVVIAMGGFAAIIFAMRTLQREQIGLTLFLVLGGIVAIVLAAHVART